MAGKQTLKGSIVEEQLRKFPNTPSKTLAAKIYKGNNEVFKDAEEVRTVIRYYRGANGNKTRKEQVTGRDIAKDWEGKATYNPFGLPESFETDFTPFDLPKSCKKILHLSDLHIPYHSITAVTTALHAGREYKPDTVILNGDLLDFYQLSSFEHDPRKRHFSQELEAGREFLRILRNEFPDAQIYFKKGNHEERLERYLKVKAPELLDIEEFQLNILLRFGELKIHTIPDKRIVRAGKLNILHGHEFRTPIIAPVNPARGYFMKSKDNIICGHSHRSSHHSEPTLGGKQLAAWSVGCLAELSPEYMPINSWNWGYATVDVFEDGTFAVDNKIIDGDRTY